MDNGQSSTTNDGGPTERWHDRSRGVIDSPAQAKRVCCPKPTEGLRLNELR